MMKKMWKMRKDKSAVSPVIATILMVAITVVLAAVLYVMVMGFGTGGSATAPTASLTKSGSLITVTINPQTNSANIGLQVTGTGANPTSTVLLTAGTVTINGVVYPWTFTATNTGKVTTGDTITMTGTGATIPVSIQLVYLPSGNIAGTDKQLIGNVITF